SIDVGASVITARSATAGTADVGRASEAEGALRDGAVGSDAPSAPERSALLRLRELAEGDGGLLRFEWLPTGWVGARGALGEEAALRALVESLKQRFDPRGILSRGRDVTGT